MAAKSLANRNRKYIATTRKLSSVFAELDKTSVTQPNDYVNVKASSSPNVSRVVIALAVTVAITVVVSVVVVVVISNRKGDEGETTTVSPADEPQATDSLSSRPTDTTSASIQTTEITSTEPGEVLWSGWGEWTQCTTTCNSGIHRRYRRCIVGDSSKCLGDFVETEICQESTCPVYWKWTAWGSWGSCDITCGKGRQFRVRTCTKSESTDMECVGSNEQEKTCADWKCPDCSTVCTDGTLNSDCDTCVCNGTVVTGRVLAETTGNPVSNVALYASTAPTKLLTLSNSTGYFALEATCINTTLFVSREGFVDTEVEASNTYFEISMPQMVLPYLTETPQSKYRLATENVTMCCEAVASPSIDYFEWFKDEILLDQTLFQNGKTLTLFNLTITSSGRYQCRANSAAGAIMSPAAILTVKESSDDFCADALQQKTVALPDDCVQISTNTATYPVGECISKKCRKDALLDFGTCREDNSTCCMTGEAALEKVQCSGYELELVLVKSCTCAVCDAKSLRISGTARGLEDNSPLKYGEIWANDVFKGYTSITGEFNFEVSKTSSTTTINLVDNYFQQFLQAVKVIKINDDLSGVLHIEIMMIKAAEPVELDSTIENTLVAEASVDNDSTPIVQISIPANAFYYRDGTQYVGTVQARLTFLDPTNTSILENIPGVFQFVDKEGQSGNLASLAVFNLYFEDTSDQSLVLDEVVDLYVPEELGNSITDQDIKLWKMNAKTGIWEYVTSGTGTRRKKRQLTAGWIGEIDWSTVSKQDWFNYDKVLNLTNNTCFFKIRLFTDKLLTEPVQNPEKLINVDIHFFDSGILTTINDYLYYPEDECIIGICEGNDAYISLYYYGFSGYETLYAGKPNIRSIIDHNYALTDDDKVLKIQMTASDDGPFYENKTQCLVSNSNQFHLRYNYGKEYEGFIPILTFTRTNILVSEESVNMSRRAWYPFRKEGIRACFIKVRLLFERGMNLSSGQYIKLKATSYGGTNENIKDTILGIKEYIIGNKTENSTYCIEYKCSGKIDPVFGEQTEHTRVVLALTYPSSEIRCEVSDEADFVSDDPTSLNVAQEGSDLGTYEFYAPLVYTPELGIYSATNSEGDSESARDIAERECQSGEPQNLNDVYPDIGVSVTFSFMNMCRWWYGYLWC